MWNGGIWADSNKSENLPLTNPQASLAEAAGSLEKWLIPNLEK